MKRIVDSVSAIRWEKVLWAAFLLSLPVTSFPWLPAALGGATTVRPLAVLPLIALLGYVLVRRIFREPLPRSYLPLLLFVLLAVAGGALAVIRPIPEFRGVSSLDRVIRNLLTLGMGVSFYLVVSRIPQTRGEMRFTVRWLLIGFSLPLLWSSLQALYVLFMPGNEKFWAPFFDRLNTLHHLLSTRNLQEKRVTGLAYEPSWFAEQLSILVLPWLLTHVIRRATVFKRRFKRLLVEDLLLVWVSAIMVLTFSRTGLVIFFVLVGATILTGSRKDPRELSSRLARLLAAGRFWQRAALFALVAVLFAGVVFSAGSRNRYFSRMWRFFTEEDAGGNYWSYIAFGQRFVYWEAALDMFEQEPVFGIGVGNYALYFDDSLPDIPLYQYPEILDLIVPEQGRTQLVTPKNLFLRVLAETGLVGFVLFAGFWLVVLGEALSLWFDAGGDEEVYNWGRAGVLGLAAAFLVSFSTDSFAMPNTWVLMGLITAARRIVRPNLPATESPAAGIDPRPETERAPAAPRSAGNKPAQPRRTDAWDG